MNTLDTSEQQLAAVAQYLDGLAENMDRLPVVNGAAVLEMSE